MISIIRLILSLIGLGNWLDKAITAKKAKQQAQEVASAPTDKQETITYFNDK